MFFGIDPNHSGLIEASQKAHRLPGRNLHYLLASYESLPGCIAGSAESVSVLFPWGSLLKAVAGGDANSLCNLRALCKPGASAEVVTAIDAVADAGELARLGMQTFEVERMRAAWTSGGFDDIEILPLPAGHQYQTTWWRRIRQREGRVAIRLTARA